MASLLEIKKQIAGVNNTRKITKAMELVAASKMRQFQVRAQSARGYVNELFTMLHQNIHEKTTSIYTEKRDSGKTLFVLYTSDKGLCGPLNNKLINALFRSNHWKDLPENERLLITIGKKSETFAKNNKIKTEKNFAGIPEKLTNLDAIKVVEEIIEIWKTQQIKEVIFIAPHYHNSFTFYPILKTFLPFSEESIKKNLGIKETEESEAQNSFMLYEPSAEEVLNKLYEQIIQSIFIQSFLELKASEYSSRMIAMKNATDAANKMIGALKRTFNKARQSAITQEIAELIGASMAMSEE